MKGDTIIVTNGVYDPIVTDNKAITIQSVNGAAATIVDAGHTNRCATLGSHPTHRNTVLVGFTLQNGNADDSIAQNPGKGGGSYGGTLNNCTLSGNAANDLGGGSYGGTLNNCTLSGNSASVGGGSYGGKLNNCTLSGNAATLGGGSGDSTLNNCTLSGNAANQGGGSVDCILKNCTLSGNLAEDLGGGSCGGTLNNCIVWYNQTTSGNMNNYCECVIRYSCTFPLPEGEGNISEDPRLVDMTNGDLRLRIGSPCIDAGSDTLVAGSLDIAGNPRIQGARVDMGAYEGSTSGYVITARVQGHGLVSAMTTVVTAGGSAAFTATETLRPFVCFLTNGIFASANPTFTWAGIQSDGIITAVFETKTYYVDASRPDDNGNGLSWDSAQRTIQKAISFAMKGDTIIVTNGVYDPIVTDNKAITIQSVNGADATIIDAGHTNRCATLGSHPTHRNTVLVGFTLQNGNADFSIAQNPQIGGGSYGGTLNNCTLSGNAAIWVGGGSYGGTLNNCTLSSNTASYGGGSSLGKLNNCTLSGNSAYEGGGSSLGTLNNCTLSGNSADQGGGSSLGTLNNCTLSSNTASYGGGSNYSTLNNCTLSVNSATLGGGSYGGMLNNCIVWNNNAAEDEFDNYAQSVIRYSCASPLPEGEGNISDDPRFMDAANGDFRLLSDSPCLDAGNNVFVTTLTDLVGQSRIFGIAVDMGAYEFVPETHQIARLFNLPPETVGLCGTSQGSGFMVISNVVAIKGSIMSHNASSGFTFSPDGPGRLTFRWNVSSEYYYDTLNFYVDNALTAQISGKNVTWSSVTNTVLTAGPHTFKWEYAKDVDTSVGQDTAWISDVAWTPRSTLTVENGTGDGDYFIGDVVPVIADAAPEHFTFDRWKGDTNGLAGVFAPSTLLTMPGVSALLTATYTPILYPFAVTDGSGGGDYPYHSNVVIIASSYENRQFYRWTGDVDTVTDVWAATTTVQTADHLLSVGATYSYPLTVDNGTGGGWYTEGASVNVTAGAAPLYKEFGYWTGSASGLLADPSQEATTLTMPAATSTLTPAYVDSISRVSGSYGRDYSTSGTAGGVMADTEAASPSGTPAVKLGGIGVVPDNGFTAFETVVMGRGTVTFWWKVSSEGGADYLNFLVDGNPIKSISGTKVTWVQVTNRVEGAGVEHTLRWEYVKDVSEAFGSDAGWVDDIVWIGDVAEPALTPSIIAVTATNSLMAIDFIGERGISYVLQTNATLNALGWGDWTVLSPAYVGETNGVHRFNVTPPMQGADRMFYRVIGR
jgi:hypothetical protein